MTLNSVWKQQIYHDFRRYFLVEISSLLCMCIEAIKRKSQNQKCDVVKCSFCKSLICKLHILLHSRTFLKQHHSRLNYLTRKDYSLLLGDYIKQSEGR